MRVGLPCRRRIFLPTIDARIIALDAKAGTPCTSFADRGTLNLRRGLRNTPFETAELERLIREKPELEIFKRRLEAVHGLLGQAVQPEREPMRLAPERRG